MEEIQTLRTTLNTMAQSIESDIQDVKPSGANSRMPAPALEQATQAKSLSWPT